VLPAHSLEHLYLDLQHGLAAHWPQQGSASFHASAACSSCTYTPMLLLTGCQVAAWPSTTQPADITQAVRHITWRQAAATAAAYAATAIAPATASSNGHQ
jgi:hypothetical protein